MTHFSWSDALSVGDAMIDGDHRRLLRLTDELKFAVEQGDGRDVLRELIEALIVGTKEHLKREEVFMQGIGYADFPTHRQYHDKLMETVQHFKKLLDVDDSRLQIKRTNLRTRIHSNGTRALKMEIDYTQKLSVLLVDGVQAHRFLMGSGIKRMNPFSKIDQAASLDEAITKLSSNSYNAVISDWSMPSGGGAELIKWMRARAHFRRVPFIMISGKNDNKDIINAFMELQVDAYVVKPFAAGHLYEKMMTAIDKRQKLTV